VGRQKEHAFKGRTTSYSIGLKSIGLGRFGGHYQRHVSQNCEEKLK